MKNILITGGAGFIGINLARKLMYDNNVLIIDNLYSSGIENLLELKDYVNYIPHDVRNSFDQLGDEFIPDHIYHLACPASPPAYQKNAIYTHETAVLGMINVLQYAKHHDSTVLFTSTSEIYGDPQVDIQNESYRGNVRTMGIRSCYDEGKRMAETICYDYHCMHGIDIKVARIFNTYGPYMNPQDGRIVSNFINQALDGLPLTIYGDGTQTRSLSYADDTVDFLIKLMNSNHGISAINVGNPVEMTVNDIASVVEQHLNTSEREYVELPMDDPRKRKPDISKAKDVLGWEPSTPFSDGLVKTIEYFKSVKEKQPWRKP